MAEIDKYENAMLEIARYETRIRNQYEASLKGADTEVKRRIERQISSLAVKQFEDHWERIQEGSITVSDGL